MLYAYSCYLKHSKMHGGYCLGFFKNGDQSTLLGGTGAFIWRVVYIDSYTTSLLITGFVFKKKK